MNIDVIENTTDTIIANIGYGTTICEYETVYNIITVAEYWKDKDKFIIYDEIFEEDGTYVNWCKCKDYSETELEEIKNYLIHYDE